MDIAHFQEVNQNKILANFFDGAVHGTKHRISLYLPFKERTNGRTICIIGQNPSDASEKISDKTITYLERLIYEKFSDVEAIIVLNLFSKVDKHKKERNDLLSLKAAREFRKTIKEYNDFVVFYGKLKKCGAYDFKRRASGIRKILIEKNVLKIDIGTKYTPHPGNKRICYNNYSVNFTKYDFKDVRPLAKKAKRPK